MRDAQRERVIRTVSPLAYERIQQLEAEIRRLNAENVRLSNELADAETWRPEADRLSGLVIELLEHVRILKSGGRP
jgi:hypothetical protein